MTGTGSIAAIFVADRAAAPMRALDEVRVVAGRGLAGDRYASSAGTFSRGGEDHSAERQVTFIESEAVVAVRRDHGIELDASETRRNIVTTGVALNHLVGRTFDVGGVRFRGVSLCEPCSHLEEVSGRPVRKPLIHRGGLNAEALSDGLVRIGDVVHVGDRDLEDA